MRYHKPHIFQIPICLAYNSVLVGNVPEIVCIVVYTIQISVLREYCSFCGNGELDWETNMDGPDTVYLGWNFVRFVVFKDKLFGCPDITKFLFNAMSCGHFAVGLMPKWLKH